MINKNIETERKLKKMQALKSSLKEIQAEFDQLKSEVITNYFVDNAEYKTKKGLVLATYTLSVRNSFNSNIFKKDHPSLYEKYQTETSVSTFLLK